ncbi:PKD domain-containing protein [Nocardioides agariphilus]|uniref:PKD domain-containing protein n=1 Tax=Nocardioides agariphilus TaxID=433664 RepID=A0A930VIK2_9ACTN|nr:PKD domain-containing protein [Nocardioides agariphilus]MBF4768204.1 PKD domain-containing protein [Nocardioides agariphilus]
MSIPILWGWSQPASASSGCLGGADMHGSYLGCFVAGDELRAIWASAPANVKYMLRPICASAPDHPEEICATRQVSCLNPPDSFRYWVFRSIGEGPFEPVASTCLGDAGGFEVITPGRVLHEMKRMTWPAATLSIQPPDGRTLVNFKTNFFTTTTEPDTQTITLLGQRVEIEASPVSYTWHFGDGEKQSGADPGAPYPNLDVTHTYRKAEVTVRPSVDVTYHGRFRVNGGQWQDIPETLTVAGTPTQLQVLTATPHLVG